LHSPSGAFATLARLRIVLPFPLDPDVLVVGAGASGLGVGVALRQMGVEKLVILDRHAIGASFERWPREMRFITPSFDSQAFGSADLNSICPGTSPAFQLGVEHPSGIEYARYLRRVAEMEKLPVHTGYNVRSLHADEFDFSATIDGPQGEHILRPVTVVWAAGEFQYPRDAAFPGAELCLHNSLVASWQDLQGEEFTIIGGYESGIDAACHLAAAGKRVTVLDHSAPWERKEMDPSDMLSPFTRQRLRVAREQGRIELLPSPVRNVTHAGATWQIDLPTGPRVSLTIPILATGFESSLSLVAEHFDWDENIPVVNEHDESTRTSGLYLTGPMLRHKVQNGMAIFCFLYKFRGRFPVIAANIGEKLGLDPLPMLARWRHAGMLLDDLSCCADTCQC
jgi:putative flavoprotein involved in K+ transport